MQWMWDSAVWYRLRPLFAVDEGEGARCMEIRHKPSGVSLMLGEPSLTFGCHYSDRDGLQAFQACVGHLHDQDLQVRMIQTDMPLVPLYCILFPGDELETV